MNADQLLELYDRVAEAPDAIPLLRRFVLDLAVRGKLVEQDVADEPASELLKRIKKERAKAGLKSPTGQDVEEGVPFDLPLGWAWSDIGGVCTKTGSGSTPRGGKEVYLSSGVPFLRSQNVYDDGLRLNDVAYIAPDTHEKMSGTSVKSADLLLNITGGSMGRCCRISDDFTEANVSQHVAIIRPAMPSMANFLHLLVLSPYFQAFIFDEQTGAGRGGLPKNRMDRIAVALPPLAEQHRIVAKVDELMALLDRLEQARAGREALRDQLTAATLNRLTQTEPQDFQPAAHFALQTLSHLTTRPDQIKTLRQTILNLAVRGKLVAQDAADEPASELLKRIAKEKARLVKAGEIANTKVFPALRGDELPFTLPVGWEWSQITSIGIISPRVRAADDTPASFVPMAMIAAEYGVTNRHEVRPWGEVKKGFTTFGEGDVGLAKITPCFENGKSTVFRGLTGGFGAGTTELHVVRPIFVNPDYIVLFLKSPTFIETGIPKMTGTAGQKRVPTEYFATSPFPLPPLAEQHRIVARVDALMALCDQLEAGLTQAASTRTRLLDALLHAALNPAAA